MNWIPSLLKHLSIARSAIVAVFVTAAALYVGPRIAPGYIDKGSQPWSLTVQISLIFTGCLVVIWSWEFLSKIVLGWGKKLSMYYKSKKLNGDEKGLLLAMGENPRNPLNLEAINFRSEGFPLSELELLHLLSGLCDKGLVSMNTFYSNLYSLTYRGRNAALEIARSESVKENCG